MYQQVCISRYVSDISARCRVQRVRVGVGVGVRVRVGVRVSLAACLGFAWGLLGVCLGFAWGGTAAAGDGRQVEWRS